MFIRRVLRNLLAGNPRAHTDSAGAVEPVAPVRPAGETRHGAALPYKGYFINLDRSDGRRRDIQTQLLDLGLAGSYERFPAVDGRALDPEQFKLYAAKPGSPAASPPSGALEAGRRDRTHLHIIEDDVVLARSLAPTLASIIDRGLLARYDLVYTDTLVPFKPELIREYLRIAEQSGAGGPERIQLVNLRGRLKACQASYLVNRESVDKIIALLAAEVRAGITLPVDIHLRNLVNSGALNAALTLPFLTAVRLDQTLATTVQGEYEAAVSVMLHNLLRNQFFVDRDDEEFERCLAEYVDRLALGGATRNIARLSAFFLSDRHRDF